MLLRQNRAARRDPAEQGNVHDFLGAGEPAEFPSRASGSFMWNTNFHRSGAVLIAVKVPLALQHLQLVRDT
jgi:hypothetical protein